MTTLPTIADIDDARAAIAAIAAFEANGTIELTGAGPVDVGTPRPMIGTIQRASSGPASDDDIRDYRNLRLLAAQPANDAPIYDWTPRPLEQQLADEGVPEALAVLAARQTRDFRILRRSLRAFDGMLRATGRRPAVEQPYGAYMILNQGQGKQSEKHYTR